MAAPPAVNGTNVTIAELWVSMASACIISVMTPIGLIGNSLVVAAVILSNKLRTKTNAFVVSLAVTDILTCASFPVQAISLFSQNGAPPGFLCAMTGAIIDITLLASTNNLMLIAVNRWFKITQSVTTYSRVYSQRNMVLMIVLSWTHPFIFTLVPAIAEVTSFGYSDSLRVCYLTDDPEGQYYLAATMGVLNIIFDAIIIGAYTSIAWVIHKKRRQVAPVGGRDVKGTKTLAIVVFVYLVSIGLSALCYAFIGNPNLWICASVLVLSNSIVNPFIYAYRHPVFRQTFRCIIKCRYREIPEPSRELRSILRLHENS